MRSVSHAKIAVQQKWRRTLDDHKKIHAEQEAKLQIPQRAKLTPLFWNTEKCKFDDIWTKEDPTVVNATCGATQSLLNNLVHHRESRFKHLWKKQ